MTISRRLRFTLASSSIFFSLLLGKSQAELLSVTVTVQNLAPTGSNGISFAPLRLGFSNGTFDSFNNGQTGNAAIVSIAEGGSGSDWFPAFQAAEPNSVRGSVGGALLPGSTASNTFVVDSAVNQFFTFGTMVIPSNDLFLGNDSPTAFRLFNPGGSSLLIPSITQRGSAIWDANSEVADPLNAAFVVGGTNANRTPENGLVAFDFSELAAFNGVNTAGGYTFSNAGLTGATDVYRISFSASAVPEPSSIGLASVALGFVGFRRRRQLQA